MFSPISNDVISSAKKPSTTGEIVEGRNAYSSKVIALAM